MSCSGDNYKPKRAAGCSGQPSPREAPRDLWGSWAFNAGAVTVGFMCAATSFLSWSMPTYPAYRCPAWRRPSHTASPESAPWPSRWGTSPPWAALSCTPPVFQKRGEWSHLSFYVSYWCKSGKSSPRTILLLISWKWISHTFSTTSSFSNVTKPNPDEQKASLWVKKTIDHNNSHNMLELDNRPFCTVVQLNSLE